MNKNAIAVALSAGAYSILFYNENAGLNIFIFNLLVVVLNFWISNPSSRKDLLIASGLTLVSASSVLIHGSDLAIFANIVSLLILSAASFNPTSSVPKMLVNGVSSVASSGVISIVQAFKRRQQSGEASMKRFSDLITYIVPIFIAIIFLALYRQSNPLFEKVTDFLSLDFITIDWIIFTLGGIYLCFGLFRYKCPDFFIKIEADLDGANDSAVPSTSWNERKAFMILLLLLNTMALVINILDISYLYVGAGLPEGVTHKQFVHNGVGNLIISIILGVISLIYFLKRTERTQLVLVLTYLWIAQNAMIVISTSMRNTLYIEEALLTYKRIGVYCWLLLALFGLITLVIKILNRKNTWYFIKINALIAWVCLVTASVVDWDYFISLYNVRNRSIMASLDKKYLLDISEGNIGLLYSVRNEPGFNTDSVWHYRSWDDTENRKLLDAKLYEFLYDNQDTDWRSFNFRRARVWNEIVAIREKKGLRRMYLGSNYLPITEQTARFLYNTEWLELSHAPRSNELKALNTLPQLDSLSLCWIGQHDTTVLRQLTNIRFIQHSSTYSLNVLLLEKVPGIVFKYIPEKEKLR